MVIDKSKQKKGKTKRSPFKLWDSYRKEDKEIFFGRERESQLLYEKTFTSNLLLLYGASGTGKTSLIQCGLGNEFEDTDWLPIFIRKGENIIKSLSVALRDKAKNADNLRNNSIREKIHQLFLEQFRPVFLIFDQFEELFILGSREEQESFFTLLPELMANNFQCKIIISIREDYLAYLDEYEEHVPGLFYNRQRLERMRTEQLEEVIRGTSGKLHIQLGDQSPEAEQELIDEIITNVENDMGKVDLADLQVYLDQLYKKDQIRKVTEKAPDRKTRFDRELVRHTGELEDVLGVLLAGQLVNLEDQLEEQGARQRGIPKSVLAELVTTEGTKLNMPVGAIKKMLKQKEQIAPRHVELCIDHLIDIRILKDQKKSTGKTVEIAHDRLAKKIYSLIGGEKQKQKEIVQEIQNAYSSYKSRGALLSEEDLAYLGPYLDKIVLSREQQAFIRLSKRHARKKGIRTRLMTLGVIAVLAFSMLVAVWQWNHSRKLSITNSLSAAALHAGAVDRTKAYNLAKKALEIVGDNELAGTVLNDMLIHSNTFPFYADVLKSDKIEKFSDMAVSDDKKFLAAGSLDGRILFYSLHPNSRRDTVYAAHDGLITDVDFIRTDEGQNVLLTSGRDGKVQVRYVEGDSLRLDREFNHQKMPVFMVTREGSILLSATSDHILKWDFEEPRVLDIFCLSGVTSFEFLATDMGRFLIASSRDSMIRIKNIDDERVRDIEIPIPEGVIENMDIKGIGKPVSRWLLTGGLENGKMMIAELKKDFLTDPDYLQKKPLRFVSAHQDAIKDVSIIKQEGNQFTLLSSSRDKTARLWTYLDLDRDDVLTLHKSFLGHNDGLRAISHVRDGQRDIIFTGGEDRTIKKWIVKPYPFQELPFTKPTPVQGFTHSPGGMKVLSVNKKIDQEGEALSLFRYGQTFTGSFEKEDIQDKLRIEPDALSKVVFSATGDTILFPQREPSGKQRITLVAGMDVSFIELPPADKVLGIHSGHNGVKALLLSGTTLSLVDCGTGKKIDSVQHVYQADQAHFAPDGQLVLITAEGEEVAYWWHPGAGMEETRSLSDHTDEVLSIAFSPDQRGLILTGSKDNRFMLYQHRSDTVIQRIAAFQRHTDNVNSVAFSANGKRFLSASADGTLRLWNAESLSDQVSFASFWPTKDLSVDHVKEEKSYINLGKPILKAAFLSDIDPASGLGSRIITLDADGLVQVWNTDFIESKAFFENNIYPMEKTYADYLQEQ